MSRSSKVDHDGTGIFSEIPSPLTVGRYHSLASHCVPPELEALARTADIVMAVRHRVHPLLGIQFHPESILTPLGGALVENVIRWAAANGEA